MPKKDKPTYRMSPYHLMSAHKYSAEEVYENDFPDFFKELSKYLKKNPNMRIDHLNMSYMEYGSDEPYDHENGPLYLFEMYWLDKDVG